LLEQVDALLRAHRERLFPPTETLSMFLARAMAAVRSCRKAVDHVTVIRVHEVSFDRPIPAKLFALRNLRGR